jgi:5-methylcytosine-specific restriction endonuclease McrA
MARDASQWAGKEQAASLTCRFSGGYGWPQNVERKGIRISISAAHAVDSDGGTRAMSGTPAPIRRTGVLQTKSLVLNRSFVPVHITSVRRACVLLFQGVAKAVDAEYQTFDFDSWTQREPSPDAECLGLVGRSMRIPRVIVLVHYDRVPRRHVRFTRFNVYARDRHTCQYCGRRLPRHELNLDHVVPRSQGGQSTWENIVCSCHVCNRRKGGRTPEQSGIHLLRRPTRPAWTPFISEAATHERYLEWRAFLALQHEVAVPRTGRGAELEPQSLVVELDTARN